VTERISTPAELREVAIEQLLTDDEADVIGEKLWLEIVLEGQQPC
jgi:hypothetical protein